MNPFKKWLRICLAGVIVILKVARCPKLLLCFHYCLYIWKTVFKWSCSTIFQFLYELKCSTHNYTLECKHIFLFIDFIEVLIGPLQKFFLCSSSYFLIYILCAFYPLMFQIFWQHNTLKSYWVYQHSSWIENFFLTLAKFGPPVYMRCVLLERRQGCVFYCACECWDSFNSVDRVVILEYV